MCAQVTPDPGTDFLQQLTAWRGIHNHYHRDRRVPESPARTDGAQATAVVHSGPRESPSSARTRRPKRGYIPRMRVLKANRAPNTQALDPYLPFARR
jgi:hypothetical protein